MCLFVLIAADQFSVFSDRAHRLAREIASHWRNSASNVSNGSGPLTINGITMPTISSMQKISFLQLPEYYSTVASENTGSGDCPAESSAAARRRAEKAAAEQRRADLELLEARRQQRKLNFLITQTELYAHFMARKMASAAPDGVQRESTVQSSMDVPAYIAEETETDRILKRLEEEDEYEEELTDMDKEASDSPCNEVPTNSSELLPVSSTQQSHPSTRTSVALAAKAAASRLGILQEDEYGM